MLRGIASACQRLYSCGIMHGDLFAHNILTNEMGHALLGDFGAASLYTPTTDRIREQIDVRAFGCLMDDLLSRCLDGSTPEQFTPWRDLQEACLSEHITERPYFRDISRALSTFSFDLNTKITIAFLLYEV